MEAEDKKSSADSMVSNRPVDSYLKQQDDNHRVIIILLLRHYNPNGKLGKVEGRMSML